MVNPETSPSAPSAYSASERSCSRICSMPRASIQSTAAPRPIASAICEVPASNFHGRSVQVDSLAATVRIM